MSAVQPYLYCLLYELKHIISMISVMCRELQAKAKRMARFKDELSQPEPSSLGNGNQKFTSRVYDQAVSNQKSKKESLDMSADNPSANMSVEYEGQDSSSIISGLCPEMCPGWSLDFISQLSSLSCAKAY